MARITTQRLLEATAFTLVTFLVALSAANLFLILYIKHSLDEGIQPPFYTVRCAENSCRCSVDLKFYSLFMIIPIAVAPIGGIIYNKELGRRKGLGPIAFALMLAAYFAIGYIAYTVYCDRCDARARTNCPSGIQSFRCAIIPLTCEYSCLKP